MCGSKTVKASPASDKPLPILRNPFLDGVDPTIRSNSVGGASLRISRARPGDPVPEPSWKARRPYVAPQTTNPSAPGYVNPAPGVTPNASGGTGWQPGLGGFGGSNPLVNLY